MKRSAGALSGLHDPLALQLCSTCRFCRQIACAGATPHAGDRQILDVGGWVAGCSWHERDDEPKIGEGLVGWYPTSRFLTADEIVALGSFRLDADVCPICRRRTATDGAHAVRKKSGGRKSGRDGLQLELCRPCHTRLDNGSDQTLGVTIPRYHDGVRFSVVLIELVDQTSFSVRELRPLAGTVTLDESQRWKGIA